MGCSSSTFCSVEPAWRAWISCTPISFAILARVAVQRLEDLGDGELVLGPLAAGARARQRLRVVGIAREHLAVDLDGAPSTAPMRCSRRPARRSMYAVCSARVLGQVELTADVVGQLGPHALALVQRVERRQRTRAGRVDLEDLAVARDRLLRLAELLAVDVGHLREQLLLAGPDRRAARPCDAARRAARASARARDTAPRASRAPPRRAGSFSRMLVVATRPRPPCRRAAWRRCSAALRYSARRAAGIGLTGSQLDHQLDQLAKRSCSSASASSCSMVSALLGTARRARR